MRPIPNQRISKNALKVWRILGAIETFIYMLLLIGYYFLSTYFQGTDWIKWTLLVIVISIGIIKVVFIPTFRWRRWRYEVYEQEIDLQFGIIVVRRVLIPMIRIQHVDTRQGPLLKYFRLASVTVTTAATVHQIPALPESQAANLRDRISKLAAEADEDV
ncbi:hypothetical protein BKP37_07215 [Anaerobacillus alkalilacustris]|uniref:YdbS-like PH domain-containing protein n=1 Tax=Anaerobacillus alkalilacustris TaxID=393763 RepID=A0A1S2LQI3_9BACI|nr:PH domain-containing protein [Anaerobacillus alkalilacustris]OIJ14762.1 hypothetical protein BKP37_07215 [Anaerobacillus alkalilacustris]